MASGSAERGFTYLAVLLAVAVLGIGLAATGQSWSTAAQRAREAELLAIGHEFRAAIRSYYEGSPGSAKRYPARLEDLLEDRRFPFVRRHLRRIYRDPLTLERRWGVVEAPEGGIMGVHSLSRARPLKSGNFDFEDRAFEGKSRYDEWRFTYAPQAPPAAPTAR